MRLQIEHDVEVVFANLFHAGMINLQMMSCLQVVGTNLSRRQKSRELPIR